MAESDDNVVGGASVEVTADLTKLRAGLQQGQAETKTFEAAATQSMRGVSSAAGATGEELAKLATRMKAAGASAAEFSAYVGKGREAQAAWNAALGQSAGPVNAVAAGAKQAASGVQGLHIQTALATRELVVMGREIARGNFSRLAGSATILAQSMGILAYAFTPVGLSVLALTAAMAAGIVAVVNFEAAEAKLQRTMEATGRVSGLTTAAVKAYADQAARASGQSPNVAATSAAAYASAGVQDPDVMKNLIRVTQEYADLTGQKVPKAQEELAAAMAEPDKAGLKLLNTWGLLDEETKRNIQTAMAFGNEAKAQEIIVRRLAGTLDDTTRAGGYAKTTMERLGSAFDQMGRDAHNAIGSVELLTGSLAHFIAVKAGLAQKQPDIGAEAAQQAKDARNAALARIEQRADEAPGAETPEDKDYKREQELKGAAEQKRLAAGAASLLGDTEGVKRYNAERKALTDTIGRNTDAQGHWIGALQNEHLIMQATKDLYAARHAHHLQDAQDAEDRIKLLKAADTVETNAQARQAAADAAANVGAKGVGGGRHPKDTFGPQTASKEADAQAEIALAEAYGKSDSAAIRAEASRKALTEATLKGRTAAQTAKLIQDELNLSTAKMASEFAKKAAEMREESDETDRANAALVKGDIGAKELNRTITEGVEIHKAEAAAEAANGAAKAELLKQVKALKDGYDALDTSRNQSEIARDIDSTRDEIAKLRGQIANIGKPRGVAAAAETQRAGLKTLSDQGVSPTSDMGKAYLDTTAQKGALEEDLAQQTAKEKLTKSVQEEIAAFKEEGAAYGMTKQAAATYLEYHKLLNEAQKEGIVLDDKEKAALAQLAAAYGQAEVSAKKLTDAQKAAQQASQSLSDTFTKGLEGMIYDGDKLNVTLRSMSQQIGKETFEAVMSGQGPFAGILGTQQNAAGQPGGIMNNLVGSMFGIPGTMGGKKPTGAAGDPLHVVADGGGSMPGAGGGSQGGIMGLISSLFGGGGSQNNFGANFASEAGDLSEVAGMFHVGTPYVGTPGRMVSAPSALFIDAPRLHSGLAPDEFPAILQRGERVTPRGGGQRGGNVNVNIHVSTPDTTSFGRTSSQIQRETKRHMSRL